MILTTRIARITLLTVGTASLAVTVACGGGSATSPAAQVEYKSGGNVATSGTVAPHTDHVAEIDQQNMAFMPARVSIKVGETVLIKNSETAIHTGNINGKNITGNMKKGDSVAWTGNAPGEYKISCDYHPQMAATITVS